MNVLEKILEELENESQLAHEEMRRCARGNPLQFDEVKGYARAMEYVVDTIRSHMEKLQNMHGKRLIDANALDEEVRNFFLTIIGDPSQSTVVRECKESFRRMIDEQPTVYETNDWIPVEEKLPEESGYYMACIYNEEVDDYDFRKTWFAYVDDYDMDESEWRELYDFERVTAWQPLPNPYIKSPK